MKFKFLSTVLLASMFFNSHAGEIKAKKVNRKIAQSVEAVQELQMEKERVDKELNQVYKEKMKKLSKDLKSALVREERLWVKYRDNFCFHMAIIEGGYDGTNDTWEGNLGYSQNLSCTIDETKERISQIKKFPIAD